jgi:predicted RNA-binding protein with PUA-like domain
MKYWLLKTEPDCFSIDDLARQKKQTTSWDGVRNYQARNFMRDEMRVGDLVFFYHSSCDPPGIAGICEVVRAAYPDHTAFDPADHHFDPRSKRDNPTWMMVDIRLKSKFAQLISLETLRTIKTLNKMELLRQGSRLSVQPVRKQEFDSIVKRFPKADGPAR